MYRAEQRAEEKRRLAALRGVPVPDTEDEPREPAPATPRPPPPQPSASAAVAKVEKTGRQGHTERTAVPAQCCVKCRAERLGINAGKGRNNAGIYCTGTLGRARWADPALQARQEARKKAIKDGVAPDEAAWEEWHAIGVVFGDVPEF